MNKKTAFIRGFGLIIVLLMYICGPAFGQSGGNDVTMMGTLDSNPAITVVANQPPGITSGCLYHFQVVVPGGWYLYNVTWSTPLNPSVNVTIGGAGGVNSNTSAQYIDFTFSSQSSTSQEIYASGTITDAGGNRSVFNLQNEFLVVPFYQAYFVPVASANPVCLNTSFTLSLNDVAGITSVQWIDDTNGQSYPPTTDPTNGFEQLIGGISSGPTTFHAIVTGGCSPSATFSTPPVTIMPLGELASQVAGERDVVIGDNQGVVTLTNYTGIIQYWQSSANNGVTWSTISQTTEEIAYENLTVTTRYRAITRVCGTDYPSGNCSIRVHPPTDDVSWTQNEVFDVDGGPVGIAATRTYFDSDGKTLQNQSINYTAGGVILASQPLYSKYGQAVGSTLVAPITASRFTYTPSFISAATAPYDYKQFDETTTRNAPSAVASATSGTLGWYYSANNTLEPYTATTAYPYSRTDAEPDGSTGVMRSTLPGDAFRLGQGKESVVGRFAVGSELDTYLALRSQYFTVAEMGASVNTLESAGTQQVSIDANGQRSIAILDKEGHTVMAMRPGETGRTWLTVHNTVTVGWRYSISVPSGQTIDAYTVDAPTDIMVYDGYGQWVYTGPANTLPSIADIRGYTVYCNSPLSVNIIRITVSTPIPSTTITPLPLVENQCNEFYNFYTLAPATALTITPALTAQGATEYELINTVTGAIVSQSSISNLPAGFYQIRIKKGQLTMAWRNTFQDISFSFYNQKGLLLGSLAPNGAKLVLEDYVAAASAYTRTTLPFFTRYEYDQQARLLAMQDPDAGRTEYLYRTDGKLRFSQNAKQRASDDGNFSYVGYDAVGRAIESGQCVPFNRQYFTTTARTSPVLEAIGSGLPDNYPCQDVVKTTYDVPVTSLPSVAGGSYTQSFVAGRVSMTAKYWQYSVSGTKSLLCSTWFGYDDQGRTQWQIQQTANQPARTVDYTYSFIGNVESVCYQKNTPAERLTHYYVYDDDRKLMQVSTDHNDPAASIYGQRVEQAAYSYYLHGPLKRIVYGRDLQGVDYAYTAQGWLKSINDGELARDPGQDGTVNTLLPDLFGTSLHYYPHDYVSRSVTSALMTNNYSPARYDGTVWGNMWQTPGSPLHMYTYGYDKKGQLTVSQYGRLNASSTRQYYYNPYYAAAGGAFFEGDLDYDPNGNLKYLARTSETGASSMAVSYQYLSGTNKLAAVNQGQSTTPVISYDYDELGQMTAQTETAPNKSQVLDYDASGKVVAIYRDAARTQLVASYAYDEFGKRLQQRVIPNPANAAVYTTTTFVRDAAGNELASYVNTSGVGLNKLYEQPIYGATRVGTYRRQRDNEPAEQLYELNDQLGNTRVVFRRPQKETYMLSMESAFWDVEKEPLDDDEKFRYEVVISTDYSRKTTSTGAPNPYGLDYSMHLQPGGGMDTGPVRRLVVQRGDHIHMEAWAAYPDASGGVQGRGTLLIAGAAALGAGTSVAAPVDNKQPTTNLPAWKQLLSQLSLGVAIPLASKGIGHKTTASVGTPKAALQYVLKRQRDNSFLRNGTAYVSTNAEGQWEELDLDVDITETEPSILEISVQNYDDQLHIYFDDVQVDYTDGPVVQENHFYAYGQRLLGGATDFMSWERKDRRKYGHGYQGLYATADEESGYDGFELRLYDSRIGRWLSTDPAGQYHSPYVGMGNDPTNGIDPDGAWLFGLFGSTSAQRHNANADASANDGEVRNYFSSNIYSTWGGNAQRYESDGTRMYSSSSLANHAVAKMEAEAWSDFGRTLSIPDRVKYGFLVEGCLPDYTIESFVIPVLPTKIATLQFLRGTSLAGALAKGSAGGLGKRMGGAVGELNYYTNLARDMGYGAGGSVARVRAGIFVQANHGIGRIFQGKMPNLLFSKNPATIMGRQWQNEAIGSGLLGMGVNSSIPIYYNSTK